MHIAHALYIWNKQHKKRTRHISLTFLQHMNYRCNQHLEQLIRLPRGRRCCLTFGYIFSLSSHIVLKYKDFVFKNSWSKLSQVIHETLPPSFVENFVCFHFQFKKFPKLCFGLPALERMSTLCSTPFYSSLLCSTSS